MLENIDPITSEIVETNPNEFDMDIVLQHNGASANYSREIRNYSDNYFSPLIDAEIQRNGHSARHI